MIMIQKTLGFEPQPEPPWFRRLFENWNRFTQMYVGLFLLGTLFFWDGGDLISGGSCVIGPSLLGLWVGLGPVVCAVIASFGTLIEAMVREGTYEVFADTLMECWDTGKTFIRRTYYALLFIYLVMSGGGALFSAVLT